MYQSNYNSNDVTKVAQIVKVSNATLVLQCKNPVDNGSSSFFRSKEVDRTALNKYYWTTKLFVSSPRNQASIIN